MSTVDINQRSLMSAIECRRTIRTTYQLLLNGISIGHGRDQKQYIYKRCGHVRRRLNSYEPDARWYRSSLNLAPEPNSLYL